MNLSDCLAIVYVLILGQRTFSSATGVHPLNFLAPYFSQRYDEVQQRNFRNEVPQASESHQPSGNRPHQSRPSAYGPFMLPLPRDKDIALVIVPYSRSKGLPENFNIFNCRPCDCSNNNNNVDGSRNGNGDSETGSITPSSFQVGNSIRDLRDSRNGRQRPSWTTESPSGTRFSNAGGIVSSTPNPRIGSTIFSNPLNQGTNNVSSNNRGDTRNSNTIRKDVRFRYPDLYP